MENFVLVTRSDGSSFCGGILADEMGLGKTVEMLSCIASNTAPPEVFKFYIFNVYYIYTNIIFN